MSGVPRHLRGLATALATVALLLAPMAGVARAAGPSFGTPSATISYDQSIVFTVPFSPAGAVSRVELRMRFADNPGLYIVDVPAGTGANQTLRYTRDLTGDGHLVPNVPIEVTWAAVMADGSVVTSQTTTVRYTDTTHAWQTLRGSLVTVHWYDGPQSFAERALQIGEKAIRDTSALLGVTETQNVDFFIYSDDQSFRDALGPGTRENVGGEAHADIRTLFALITPDAINDPWVGVVIPHELVHLVFDTAVRNPYRFPPRWFNEGLAVYLSEGNTPGDQALVQAAIRAKTLIPLDALGGQFPTDPQKTSLAYAESVSAIDFLVRKDGREALLSLVRAYKDGVTDDEAFSRALGADFEAFQAAWLTDLGASPPVRYGPQPAPAGPLPSGWSGPQTTPAPGVVSPPPGPGFTPVPGGSDAGPTGADQVRSQAVLAVVVVVTLVAAGLLVADRRRRAS